LDSASPDYYEPGSLEHRKNPRYRCQNSIEIHIHNGASFWATLADLSLGGCYVEMPIPIDPGTKLSLTIWCGQDKARAEGEVAHRTPGFGIGIRFTQISDRDLDLIRLFLGKLTPFAKKSLAGSANRGGL
jgi:hypothetical protein